MAERTSLADMPEKYLKCRRRKRHRFPDPDSPRVRWSAEVEKETGLRLIVMHFQCPVCTVVRFEEINRISGSLIRSGYKYPDGYLLAPGERIDPDEVRLEVLNRYMPQEFR
jgi:hypothetical protein